jgi:hypothetical protein
MLRFRGSLSIGAGSFTGADTISVDEITLPRFATGCPRENLPTGYKPDPAGDVPDHRSSKNYRHRKKSYSC